MSNRQIALRLDDEEFIEFIRIKENLFLDKDATLAKICVRFFLKFSKIPRDRLEELLEEFTK